MKATGVVRRIDDLGRIVIPKEIRRTLRIRDGETLEIFVDKDTISLKKYSSMDDLMDISKTMAEAINQSIKKNVLITDRDTVIAASGDIKKTYIGNNISNYLEQVMNDREVIINKDPYQVELINNYQEECTYIITPIISNGDVIGTVIIISTEEDVNDSDEKLSMICAQFLGKHVEE